MSNTTQNLNLFKWDVTNATDKASRFNIPVSLNGNWDNIDAFAGQIREVIGTGTDTFSTSETYEVGDIVIHNKTLYKCTTAVETAGEFDSDDWTEISIKDLIDELVDNKVNKVEGKGLSTNDYTDDEKSKLAGIATGAEVNVIEDVKVNGTVLTPSNKAVDVSVPTKTSDLSNDSGFIDKDVNNLTNYYDKNAVDTKISAVYKYKGTVSTYNDLPSTNLTIGDVYNIETADSTHGVKAGDNVAWNGTAWDVLAGTVDLSGYQTKIDSSHKLASDLVDDTNSTHKFVTSEEKTQISTNATDIDNIKDGTEIDSFGDVETVLAEKQAEIDGLVAENSTLKKQIPTEHISTTSIQLTDSAEDMPIENVKLKGATEQVQYEGYNWLSSEFEQGARSNSDGITLITSNQYVRSKNKIVVQPNTSYIVALNGQLKNGNAMFYNDENFISQTSLTESFTTPNSCNKIHVQFYDSTGISVETMGYAQLNIGSTIKPYEPYVGGQPAPNPSYTQDIHRVTGSCNEKVQNRNIVTNVVIFEDSNPFLTVLYCEADLQPDTTYAVSFLGTDGNKIYFNENLFQSYVTKTITSERQSVILTTKSNISKNNVNQYRNGYGWNFIKNNNNNTVIPSFSEFQIEPGSTTHDFEPHAEQNAPLSLGNIEAYEGDEIEIDFVQKAGYKKVTGARLVKNNAKIASYNGETITTEYKSTTGQLTTGATVVYKLATPDITEITDQTLLAQLETLINMKTYKEVTNIDLTGEDLAPVLDCDYYQDMSTLNDRLDELEARIELLEE